MKLIDTQIELSEDFLPNNDLTYDIYYDGKLNFEAILNESDNKGRVGVENAPKVLKYTLDKPLNKFTIEEIEQILDYSGLNLKEDGFGVEDVFIEKSFITLTNPPNPYTEEELKTIEENHDKIRNILMESGAEEWGDCVIDDICNVLNYPTTIVYYNEN